MRGFKRYVLRAATTFFIVGIAGIGGAAAAGALAVGACGAYGQAFGYSTIDAAQNSALKQCKHPGCRIVATLRKSCAALAVDVTNPCGPHGSGHASKLGAAQNHALRQCYQGGGKDCMIRTFVCDGKEQG
jgi:hypothetical protein